MIKIIKTDVRQTIEVELPPGYVYDDRRKNRLNNFMDELCVPIIRVNVEDKTNDH